MASSKLEQLPAELTLHILCYLDDDDIAAVQSTSRHLRLICRDDGLWRARCFGASRLASTLRRKKWRHPAHAQNAQSSKARRIEIRAAWNAVFDNGEPVSWYNEHIQRSTNIATDWFELPRRRDGHRLLDNADVLEVCGVALFRPQDAEKNANGSEQLEKEGDEEGGANDRLEGIPPLLAVAPLEDGSVCLWDVNGTMKRRGAILSQSVPGLLFAGIPNLENDKPIFNVTECVAVDSPRCLAYFAVRNRLVVVDLKALVVVSVKVFPQTITALSSADTSVPLSVGTRAGIHLYDVRVHTHDAAGEFRHVDDIIDESNTGPFPQPGPLSIVHVPEHGSEGTISKDIFAAGRISSILHYDRRNLSVVKSAIHSGASLCGLASLAYPFPSIKDYSYLRNNNSQAAGSGFGTGGRTVVACGEYKSKGSLELYPVDEGQSQSDKHMVNRQTSSSAKIFSVASHGTRLAVSDGAGFIRWFERDGFTEVRRYALGQDDYEEDEGEVVEKNETEVPRMPPRRAHNTTESGDIARKLLPVYRVGGFGGCKRDNSFRNNGLLFWTGEKLGLTSFTRGKGTRSADFVKDTKTAAERATEEAGKAYRAKMRQLFKSARYFGEDSDSDN
ncbi:f-box domain containing protein [Sporothrix brasiliensis 5110]|uniref:F-box domain containing protein n=1 Tax=Sporothrix brasiliensis 5110 TaxID=1398154 RepID=A0A0C2IYW2_9PEZI|nr:f-box domain containing protein [Sporothrix brasiliensis 5110]KIH94301.1 f-box domain containing protein [Sporothrix brasiliensis 5110]